MDLERTFKEELKNNVWSFYWDKSSNGESKIAETNILLEKLKNDVIFSLSSQLDDL